MRLLVCIGLVLALSALAPPAARPRPRTDPATRIWIGESRSMAAHWVLPSLHSRDAGEELTISVSIPVSSTEEITASDVRADLLANDSPLACAAGRSLVFTQLGGINAHATITCANPGRALPTHLVVRFRHSVETYRLQLSSLTRAAA